MAKIFVSFLGTGAQHKDPGYDRASYNWPGKSVTTVTACFAQTAILKLLEEKAADEGPVDKVVILCTEESKKKHLDLLRDELREHLAAPPEPVVPEPLVPTDMSAANQWGWFEQLLNIVNDNDTLILDFTHGMRAVPIVFSSAIGFLQRAKGVAVVHALYAWYDVANRDKVHPIVDMRDFYVINDWAEAVSRLADDANARKIGELARTTRIEALQPLADEALIEAFEEMTDCIRNVDVNNIGKKVGLALDRVEQARNRVSGSARVMLDLVWNKFRTLATDYPPSGRYDRAYFDSQLVIIRVLLEHRLFMQAFTAMREVVGSIGMAGLSGKYSKQMKCGDGRKYRGRFAEVFVNMMQYTPEDWRFNGQAAIDKLTLTPWFETLQHAEVEPKLRQIVKPLVDTRNGFDHAWTAKAEAQKDVAEKGNVYFATLETIITQLAERRLIS
jgi:CRISPR-associated Csx2 family protein